MLAFKRKKYQSLYLQLTWSKDDILAVLDKRIAHLVASRYTTQVVGHKEVFPRSFEKLAIGDYLYRIARRPRDVISYFNTCVQLPPRSANFTISELKKAEGEYSRARLRALADEWKLRIIRL